MVKWLCSTDHGVRTLGEAWKLGWHPSCECREVRPGKHLDHLCGRTWELDMPTLVLTRGEPFPIDMLPKVLRCPRCKSLKMSVVWMVPTIGKTEKVDWGDHIERKPLPELKVVAKQADVAKRPIRGAQKGRNRSIKSKIVNNWWD